MDEKVALVRGRRLDHVDAETLRGLIRPYETVVVDLGTGDGRWLYRLARARPEAFCLGIDASVENLRVVSHRAARKPARGGLPNIRFIAAAVEALPEAVRGLADEVWVLYPWGSLLRVVVAPEPAVLGGIAALLEPGGRFYAAITASVLEQAAVLRKLGLEPRSPDVLCAAVRAGYNEAGLSVRAIESEKMRIRSSWGTRLGQGGDVRTLWVEAVRHGDGRHHGGGRDRAGAAGPVVAGAAARRDRDAPRVPAV